MIIVLEKENQTKLVDNQNNYIFEVSSFKKIFQGVGTLTQLNLERLKPFKFLFLKKMDYLHLHYELLQQS